MELLLNLTWLLLALPAYFLWRDSRSMPTARRFTAVQCMLAVGCMLVTLFPVVSATDDLRAMRAEMEESPVSKRSICQSNGERLSASKSQTQPALAANTYSPVLSEQGWYVVVAVLITTPTSPAFVPSGRAPPQFLLV
jgi:hypothetical protein